MNEEGTCIVCRDNRSLSHIYSTRAIVLLDLLTKRDPELRRRVESLKDLIGNASDASIHDLGDVSVDVMEKRLQTVLSYRQASTDVPSLEGIDSNHSLPRKIEALPNGWTRIRESWQSCPIGVYH
jgi:hypothetical protein